MNANPELHHGFKRITATNWQEPDVPRLFPHLTADRWVNAILAPQLDGKVPKEVAMLFEVARGSLIYGWNFYPLITLASDQFYRVSETAVWMRCQSAGIPTRKLNKQGKMRDTTFYENIKALIKAGIIAPRDEIPWEATRKLRNWASHPKDQRIDDPGMGSKTTRITAGLLNRLFA